LIEKDEAMGSTYSTETYFSVDRDDSGHQYMARFDGNPIGEGACRVAYSGRIVESTPSGGPQVGYQCVVKVFKKQYARNYDQWIPDLVAHKRAVQMAESFNRLHLNVSSRRTIKVLTPLVAKVDTRGGFYLLGLWNVDPVAMVGEHEYVSMEPYIAGHFQKFNSNAGWSDESTMLLQTFSHWSACKSGYKYLLCDLQGVQRGYEYLITDPCIHSVDQIHGPTDLGVVGMQLFLSGHKCNFICQELGLWKNPVPYSPSTKIGSTYSFQLTEEQKRQNREKKGRYVNPMACIAEIDF